MKKTCSTCRWWSELCAQVMGDGPLEAVCLNGGAQKNGKFTPQNFHCDKWQDNALGAVDDPRTDWETIDARYIEHDSRSASDEKP